jgi:hypothetical protein
VPSHDPQLAHHDLAGQHLERGAHALDLCALLDVLPSRSETDEAA